MRRQLTSLKKNDLTAAAYFHKMKGFADAMAMVGSPISDEELIDYIVVGLGPQYESLQHSLTVLAAAGAANLSVEDFYSMLLSRESLKEQNAQPPSSPPPPTPWHGRAVTAVEGGAPSLTPTAVAPVAAHPGRLVAPEWIVANKRGGGGMDGT
jgi:hypothetical protein